MNKYNILNNIKLYGRIIKEYFYGPEEGLSEGTHTARPREIKLEHGNVSLSGFPKEVADALSEHIKNFGKVTLIDNQLIQEMKDTNIRLEKTINQLDAEPTAETTPIEFTDKAIGVYKNGTNYKMITVGYDLNSGKSEILNVKTCQGAVDAQRSFKIEASRSKFV